jgi:NADH-quinone oxidoreductase subunit J
MELNFESIVFWALAIFITISSLLTVTTKHMVRAATWLLFTLFGTAGIYFLLGYTFLGSVQIMVYAGGIVVLYVFSILLTSGEGDRVEKLKRSKWLAGLGATLAGAVIVIFITLKHKFIETSSLLPIEMDFNDLGRMMLSSDKYGYLLPFEAVSLLLLACIVGGLIIARKR